jgi:hypothetical protein
MNDFLRALDDVSRIRRQVANSTQFRGYGPATLAATGALAVFAAMAQATWVAEPSQNLNAYLALWVVTAIVGAVFTGFQMANRSRRLHSGLSSVMIRTAVKQFLPSVGAGALLTVVLILRAPAVCWMLPGLWQILFSLGVFSSCRFLPRPMAIAGAWYLLTGLVALAMGDSRALAPWTMGLAFGAGQALVAGILLLYSPEASDAA